MLNLMHYPVLKTKDMYGSWLAGLVTIKLKLYDTFNSSIQIASVIFELDTINLESNVAT